MNMHHRQGGYQPRPHRKGVERHPALPPRLQPHQMTECGVLKFYDRTRGFGFIKPDKPGPDVFVHASTLYKYTVSDRALEADLPVRYMLGEGPKGPIATAICIAPP